MIEKNFKAVSHENGPEISTNFFFNSHNNVEDLSGLEKLIKECDVFIPEITGWTPEYFTKFQKLAYGKVTPTEFKKKYQGERINDKKQYFRKIYELIYNTQKLIAIIEPPKGHPIREDEYVWNKLDEANKEKDFDAMVSKRKIFLKAFSKRQKEREEYLLSEFKNLVTEIKKRPEFKNKPKINILFLIGAAHTSLYHEVKSDYINSKAVFSQTPFVYGISSQATRTSHFNKELTDLIVARDWLTYTLRSSFYPTKDSVLINKYRTKIASKFTFQEIMQFFNLLHKDNEEARKFLIEKFKKEKIPLKPTEQEMRDFK